MEVRSGVYLELKQELMEVLASLAELSGGRGDEETARAARGLARALEEERFHVVVLGEFKRGKSTLVNALLGADVLPSGVLPLTAVVTAVTWGDHPAAVVEYRDGRLEEAPLERLAEFVTETGNPENRLGVSRVLVRYPCSHLEQGVFLVDTPGVGSVYSHNTVTALEFLPEADAAIFVTASDPPISQGEKDFLRQVGEHASRMFFVLNKVDYLDAREREEVLAFTRDVLEQALGRPVRLHPLSARRALAARLKGDEEGLEESGFKDFQEEFLSFLMAEKGATLIASHARRVLKLIKDEMNAVEVEEKALELPIKGLEGKARALEGIFLQAYRRRDEIQLLLRGEISKLVR